VEEAGRLRSGEISSWATLRKLTIERTRIRESVKIRTRAALERIRTDLSCAKPSVQKFDGVEKIRSG
jgi:hypothetical protein